MPVLIHLLIILCIKKCFGSVEYGSTLSNPSRLGSNETILIQDSCKQIEMSNERIYRMGTKNVIESWYKNGSGYVSNTFFSTAIQNQKISAITLKQDNTEIVYNQLNSKTVTSLFSDSLIAKSVFNITNGSIILNAFAKTSSKYIVITATSANATIQTVNYINPTTLVWSSGLNITMQGRIKIKVDRGQKYAFVWNNFGKYCSFKISSASPFALLCKMNSTLALTTFSEAEFSSDGTRVVLEFDNLANLMFINYNALPSATKVQNISLPYVVQRVKFVDLNQTIAIFHGTEITYYSLGNFTVLYTVNTSMQFTPLMDFDISTKSIYQCKDNGIEEVKIKCGFQKYYTNPAYMQCYSVALVVANCSEYDQFNGSCSGCVSGYDLVNGSCVQQIVPSNPISNGTASANSTSNATVISNATVTNITSNDTTNQNGTFTNDTTTPNATISNDTITSNTTVSNDTGTSNITVSNDTVTQNGTFSTNGTTTPNGTVSNDTVMPNATVSNDTTAPNATLSNDTVTSNGTASNDTSTPNATISNNTVTQNNSFSNTPTTISNDTSHSSNSSTTPISPKQNVTILQQNQTIQPTPSQNQTVENNLTDNNNQANMIDKQTSSQSSHQYQPIVQATLRGYSMILPTVSTLLFLIKVTPVAQFFLRFINYWTLTSLYVFAQINVPPPLKDAMSDIYEGVNLSFTDYLRIDAPKFTITDVVPDDEKYTSFDISIDFIEANFENFIYVIFFISFTFALHFLRIRFLTRKSFFDNLLEFQLSEVIGAQLIGMVTGFILPAKLLLYNSFAWTFKDKINLFLNTIFICVSIILPALYLLLRLKKFNCFSGNSNTKNDGQSTGDIQNQQINIQNNNVLNRLERIMSKKIISENFNEVAAFWTYFINISIPTTIILSNPIPFLLSNFFVYYKIFQSSRKVEKYRFNTMVLSLYLPLFHLGFSLMYFFSEGLVNYYAGLFCMVIFLTGGAHQIGTIIICTIYEVIQWLKSVVFVKLKRRVSDFEKKQQIQIQKRASRIKKVSLLLSQTRNILSRRQSNLQSKDFICRSGTIKNVKWDQKDTENLQRRNNVRRNSLEEQIKQMTDQTLCSSILQNQKTMISFFQIKKAPLNTDHIIQQPSWYQISQEPLKKSNYSLNQNLSSQGSQATKRNIKLKKIKATTQNKIHFEVIY